MTKIHKIATWANNLIRDYIINMPPPLTNHKYDLISNKLHKVYKEGSTKSMKAGVFVPKTVKNVNTSNDDIIDCGISIDGTWQDCGYSSLNGVVAGLFIKIG